MPRQPASLQERPCRGQACPLGCVWGRAGRMGKEGPTSHQERPTLTGRPAVSGRGDQHDQSKTEFLTLNGAE